MTGGPGPRVGAPTPPIAFAGDPAGVTGRLGARRVEVDHVTLRRLSDACADVRTDPVELAEVSRDWWPLAMTWARDDQVGGLAAAIARPGSVGEVAAVMRVCHEARIPVTPAAGRSGVSGGSVPLHGGVVLDLVDLAGIVEVDDVSLVVDVRAGTFGALVEHALRTEHRATLGHWPQSIDLSTVGGWLACRSAGQLSTRYGKVEDMVVGLDVVLADGTVVTTGGAPRAAAGPDLTQLFVGSEGTLGVITGARLRCHPAPPVARRAAYGFASFTEGLAACRRVLHRGATPAVLRLYDAVESTRHFGTGGVHVLLVFDEGDPAVVDGGMEVVHEECAAAAHLDPGLVDHWFEHRNDTSALQHLVTEGYVVDTIETAARWRDLPALVDAVLTAVRAVEHTVVASVHQSHAYGPGACCYFTFGGRPPAHARDAYYHAVLDGALRAALDHGGALSHHHGVGLNRAAYVPDALGAGFAVLVACKQALDPHGICNPGKLGLPDPFA
jgi:alkyldihydroxyacetonephosphate synthase